MARLDAEADRRVNTADHAAGRLGRAVAFDVGGVLYYDEPVEVAWLQEVWGIVRENKVSWRTFVDATVGYFRAKRSGDGGTSLFRPAGTEAWRTVRLRWAALAQPVAGMRELVGQVAEERKVLIVANQPPETAALLDQDGVPADLVALDSLVGFSKPDHRLLEWALREAGCEPHRTVVVGDSVRNDVEPARLVGCLPVLFEPPPAWITPASVDPEVDRLYRSLRSVPGEPPSRDPSARGHAHLNEVLLATDRRIREELTCPTHRSCH